MAAVAEEIMISNHCKSSDLGVPRRPAFVGTGQRDARDAGMYTSPEVQRISLDFVRGRPEAATVADEGRRALPEGTMKVTLSELELGVSVVSSNEEIVLSSHRGSSRPFLVSGGRGPGHSLEPAGVAGSDHRWRRDERRPGHQLND